MRRSQTISGLLITLARIHARRVARGAWLAIAALALVGSVAALARRATTPAPAPAVANHARARRAIAAAYARGARCAAPGPRCVHAVAPRRPAADASSAWAPAVAASAEGYGVAWIATQHDATRVYFARVGADGARIGAPVALTEGWGVQFSVDVVWTGREYGVVWDGADEQGLDLYFARVGADGNKLGATARLSASDALDLLPRLAWTGREFGVAWYAVGEDDADVDVRFARVSAAGQRVGADRSLNARSLATGALDMAWSGTDFAVAWSAYDPNPRATGARWLRVGANGEPGKPVLLGGGSHLAGDASQAWTGRAFGVTWVDDAHEPTSHVAFAAVSAERVSVPRRTVVPPTADVSGPRMAWTGSELGLVWASVPRAGRGLALSFARLAADGTARDAPRVVVSPAAEVGMPSLAWTGRGYGLAWVQGNGAHVEVRFGRLGADGARVGEDTRLSEP